MFNGELRFQDVLDTSDLDGTIDWQRKGAVPPVELAAVGSIYRKPVSYERMLTLQNAAGNAILTADGDGLANGLEKWITVNSANKATVLAPAADALGLTPTPASGLFSGSFLLDDRKTKPSFGGVILQKQNLGSGFYLSKFLGGPIVLAPNAAFARMAGDRGPLGTASLPTLRVTAPKSKARVASPLGVTLAGTAASKVGITGVYFQTMVNGVVSAVRQAAGTTNWTADLTLDPDAGGYYTTFLKAVDNNGGESELVVFNFTYVVREELTVNIAGPGTVSTGFAGVSSRELGTRYTIAARAAAAKKFVGWTGDVISASANITVTMRPGLTLQANFQ
jgi:hypothetical protein